MQSPPFRHELRAGVLILTLDTPGGAVNVFTRDAGDQLAELVAQVPSMGARALVLRTKKTRSFVNGVGLLMAGTLKSADDAVRMTGPVRQAYRALRGCSVPTIAAIQGNCFGCGIELSLHCDYRVAADSFDTHFYMTEIPEYVFIPTFGGTQDLPRLLGLERAAELVLWGPRWSAAEAAKAGLVDRVFSTESFDVDLDRFVDEVTSRPRRPPPAAHAGSSVDRDRVVAAQRARIGRLPPAYREVYGDCLSLMESAAKKTAIEEADYMNEAREAARTILEPSCRAAWPFFFLRQMASALVTSKAGRADVRAVRFDGADRTTEPLAVELTMRSTPALRASPQVRVEHLRLSAAPGERGGDSHDVVLSEGIGAELPVNRTSPVLHRPLSAVGVEVVEVVEPTGEGAGSRAAVLAAAMTDGDFTVLRSRPRRGFVIDDLVASWLAPQIAFLRGGGSPADLGTTVREFGFMVQAGDWVGVIDDDALVRLVRRARPDLDDVAGALHDLPTGDTVDGVVVAPFLSALLVSLGAFAARTLKEGALAHASLVDVAARDVVDFPLLHTSLCRHVTRARAARWVSEAPAFESWVGPGDIVTMEDFVVNGREYYVGQ